MNRGAVFGNLLLVVLMVLGFVFFNQSLPSMQGAVLDAGIATFALLLFYLFGKALVHAFLKTNWVSHQWLFRLMPSILSFSIALYFALVHLGLVLTGYGWGLLLVMILIAVDGNGWIDRALKAQLYREMEISRGFLPIYMAVYVLLAIGLLLFYPALIQ